MTESNNTEPIYTFDHTVNVRLFDCSIPKSFHDYIWDMASRHIAKMDSGSDVDIRSVLDIGTYDYLGKEGFIAAEKCLEHWAMLDYLPISSQDTTVDGNILFSVN